MSSDVALDVAEGTLLSGLLVIEPTFIPTRDGSGAAANHAKLSISFLPNRNPRRGQAHLPLIGTRLRIPPIRRRPVWETPRFNDLSIFDDRGTHNTNGTLDLGTIASSKTRASTYSYSYASNPFLINRSSGSNYERMMARLPVSNLQRFTQREQN